MATDRKLGFIGAGNMARGIAFKTHPSFGKMTADPVPAGLDWDRWLGPAPKAAYSKKRQSGATVRRSKARISST